MTETKTYTLQEAADILHISRQTLYNYIRAGKLKVPKMGSVYRVSEEQLRYIIENGFESRFEKS